VSKNRDLSIAWRYHNATKHSYASVRSNAHTLDWNNLPLLFKIYPTLEVTRLPREARATGVPALSAISAPPLKTTRKAVPTLDDLAQLLFLSAGITKSKKYPGGETFFRAAACTGALYEIELYLVTGDLPGLSAGIYHFGVAEFGLRQLRAGDYRRILAEAAAKDRAIVRAPLTIICTGTYWRNAWKYQARTYRHFGWDNGTILANMLAVTAALKFPAKIISGFVDDAVNRLLDLDTRKEVAFSLVPIGYSSEKLPRSPEVIPLKLPIIPPSKTEIDYPLMREMHDASSLDSPQEVLAWRKKSVPSPPPESPNKTIPLPPISSEQLSNDSLEEVIVRRGSSRRFVHKSTTLAQLSTLLQSATVGIPADFLDKFGSRINHLYLIANDVEGLSQGSYIYHRDTHSLELLRHGNFRKLSGYLGLEQQLPADASVTIFFLADLNTVFERLGNRGYRATQLEAGIIGGKLYLAAYAQRIGATGLTFYDDDVVRFFSPHAEKKNAIFLVALGKSS
jgi:SagB-type dehydrogenase family enzyme